MSSVSGVSRNNGVGGVSAEAASPFNLPVASAGEVKIAQRLPDAVVENESNRPIYAVYSAVNGRGRIDIVPPGGRVEGADAIAFDDDGNGIDKKDSAFRFTDGSRIVVRDTPIGVIAHHADAGGALVTIGAGFAKGGYGTQTLGQVEAGLGGFPLFFNGREVK